MDLDEALAKVDLLRDGLEVQNDVIDQMIENLNELEESLRAYATEAVKEEDKR